MAKTNIEPQGRFGTAMVDALERSNEGSLITLADKVGSTYEHMRKLVRGMAYPSKSLLSDLCKVLNMNRDEADDLITADKIQHKFGKSANRLFKHSADMDGVAREWEYLSGDQKQTLESMARTFRRQNSASGKRA